MHMIRAIALILALLCIGIGVYAFMNPAQDNAQFLLQLAILLMILMTLLIFLSRKLSKAG